MKGLTQKKGIMERKKQGEIIIVKAGSSSVSNHEIGLNDEFIDSVAEQLSFLWHVGKRVILVSSGAVAAGRYKRGRRLGAYYWSVEAQLRKESLKDKEVSAIIGQPILIGAYERAFDKYGVAVGQVLLTGDDLEKKRVGIHGSLGMSLEEAVGVINANDPLNREEMVGYEDAKDNDKLSGQLAERMKARKLILLTDKPGILDIYNDHQIVNSITSEDEFQRAMRMVQNWNGRSTESTGGMNSKLEVAWRLALQGVDVWIAQASEKDVIMKIMDGEQVGTHVYVPSLKG